MIWKFELIAVFALILLAIKVEFSNAHGRLMDPVNRSSAWRLNFVTPVNYNDNENYCGGFAVQYSKNKGKCGVCGDDYSRPTPRPNENGGLYGTGKIVRIYHSGGKIHLTVDLTVNHKGHFEFSLCPLNSTENNESEECFETYPIRLASGSYKFPVASRNGLYHVIGYLPRDLKCQHCVLRWNYKTANNWGKCLDGTEAVGCGAQETFRGCADVAII